MSPRWPRTFSNPLAYIQSSKHTFAPVKVLTAFVVAVVQVIAENQCKKYEKWYKFESQFSTFSSKTWGNSAKADVMTLMVLIMKMKPKEAKIGHTVSK